jgi:hypothetical protein
MHAGGRLGPLIAAATLLVGVATCSQSSPGPATESAPQAAGPEGLTPVLSIRELMAHIIDPTADSLFDAAVVDVSAAGTRTTIPESDDDWLKVERGLLTLAESSNLLKMPREVAPADAPPEETPPGKPAAELTPGQIQAMIDKDRGLWNQKADGLRQAALGSIARLKARDAEALFEVGGDIHDACEACHLDYWYPADKPIVQRSRESRVTSSAR